MTRRRVAALAVYLAVLAAVTGLLASQVDEDRGQQGPVPTRGQGLAIGRDGRAVALVERFDGGAWRTALVREGARSAFATVPVEGPAALTVQPDGRLLVAGSRVVRGRRLLAVARVGPDGVLDERFGDAGVATVPAGSGDAVARGLAVGGRGMVVAADARDGDNAVIATAALSDGGRPLRTELIPGAGAAGAAADARGGVLVAGTRSRDGAAVVARIAPGGARDPAYGDAGLAQLTPGLESATWRAITATPDGGAIVVGSGRDKERRSLIAAIVLRPKGSVAERFAVAAGDSDAFGSGASLNRYGTMLAGGTASEAGRPFAVTVALNPGSVPAPAPARRAPGRLAGIAGDVVLTTFWDGRRTSTSLAR
ncbi:MAG: hypothetical protein QOJ12_2482 [Thermoleophilales bacterium]|nr:hypothetical protein [Thermoleophilales bacterium]